MAFTFYTESKVECVKITPHEFEIDMLDNEEEVSFVFCKHFTKTIYFDMYLI